MTRQRRYLTGLKVDVALRWVLARIRNWRPRRPPPPARVREPRRPRPTLPAAAVALDEPRSRTGRRIRLDRRRGDERA